MPICCCITRHVHAGVDPLPLAVEKLITDYDAHGRANFPSFVKAFEDHFAKATVVVRACADLSGLCGV